MVSMYGGSLCGAFFLGAEVAELSAASVHAGVTHSCCVSEMNVEVSGKHRPATSCEVKVYTYSGGASSVASPIGYVAPP